MKYKRLFLGICLTLLMVISQAQERVLPKFKLGGALRFNYNFCDWKPGHRDRGGDFGFDVLYFKLSGSYRNIILSADYRFYSKDFGGPMLKYGWIGYQFNDKSQMQLGLTGSAFRYSTYRLAQFLPANRLLHRTRRRFRYGNQVFISR